MGPRRAGRARRRGWRMWNAVPPFPVIVWIHTRRTIQILQISREGKPNFWSEM